MFDGLNKVEDFPKNIPGNDFIKMAKLTIELKKIYRQINAIKIKKRTGNV